MRVFQPTCHVITGGRAADSRGASIIWLCWLYANMPHTNTFTDTIKLLPFYAMLALNEKLIKI